MLQFPFLRFSFSELTLPLTDPVLIYTLILPIMLLAPILLRKLKIPGIVGLILAGVAIGEKGLNLVPRSSIQLLGNMGLLYIMFIAGLEMDLNEFKKNQYKSWVFGGLTFFVPLGLGMWVCQQYLGYSPTASLLISCMFATHTLIAYPIVTRMGITRNEAVAIAVGGTIITDTAVLVILSVITGHAEGNLDFWFWLQLVGSFSAMAFLILWGYPRLGRLFFKHIQGEKSSPYLFILSLLYLAGFLSEVAGLEPIIGAFLAGLAFSQLIPHNSPLMNKVEFVGSSIFIPFFLISVGMLVDLRVLFQGPEAIIVAGVLTGVALLGKFLAAWGTQLLFGFTKVQRNLIFGLSASHAAATLAVILVGFRLGIIDDKVLNGTIILILVTCLTSSFVTEVQGRKLAISESQHKPSLEEQPEKVLVPVSSPSTLERLMEMALALRSVRAEAPIFPLCVVDDSAEASEKVLQSRRMMDQAAEIASAAEVETHPIMRVDLNVSWGISRVAKEILATEVVLGWTDKIKTSERIFGTTLDSILQNTWQSVWVCKLTQPLNTIKKLVFLVPIQAEHEPGFGRLVARVTRLADQTSGRKLVVYTSPQTWAAFERECARQKIRIPREWVDFQDWENMGTLAEKIGADDLLVVASARKGSLSYENQLDTLPVQLARSFSYNSFVLAFPMQVPGAEPPEGVMETGDLTMAPFQENLQRFHRLRRFVQNLLPKKKE